MAFAIDVRSLAVYRMALGLLLCVDCLERTRDFGLMFTADGIFPREELQRVYGDPTVWSLAFLHDASWWNGAVLAAEGLAGLLLAAGLATPIVTAAAWVVVWSVIRRTGPAACGGDVWLACQLFWSLFIPLGAVWSIDARRRAVAGAPPMRGAVCSLATAALLLQLVAVYVSAGVAKCNASWTGGHALVHALSVHDYGTRLGMDLARSGFVGAPLAWAVVAFEIVVPPLLLVWPTPRVRLGAIALFVAFHVAIGLTMQVGLFVPIGIAAWLPLLPALVWDRGGAEAEPTVRGGQGRLAAWACGVALVLAAVSLAHRLCRPTRLPRPVQAALNVLGLHQDWRMFGTVGPEERWVCARAELVDGRVVDLLRGGRPYSTDRPAGGFTSLPGPRWHNFLWRIGWPEQASLAPALAAGLARHWNAAHDPSCHVRSVEIRHARQGATGPDALERETLVGAWPPRDARGTGNLDRFLEATAPDETVESR